MAITREATLEAAEEVRRLIARFDPEKTSAIDLAAAYATADGSAIARCYALIHHFQETIRKLADPRAPPGGRREMEDDVQAYWSIYRQQTPLAGERARRLASLVELVATMKLRSTPATQKRHTRDAEYLFVKRLGTVDEFAYRRVNAASLALVHECAAVWLRGPGAPRTRDRRRSKWKVFADLHKALGLGEYDADDIKKEVSPSRKKGRTARH